MSNAVFHNRDDIVEVGEGWLERLKDSARKTELRRARLCLHKSDADPLHEMIIVFHRDTLIRPHRHLNKSESFHLIFGELDIVFFDNDGKPIRRVSMGETPKEKTRVYRLASPAWHSVMVLSEFAAIHEVTNGPFQQEESEFAPWAPAEPNCLRVFLENAHASLMDRKSGDATVPRRKA
jgi:cupin fold WbuC family metalloprotein